MSLQTRRELLFRMRNRYQRASREEKTEIINGFVAATGYNRKYAADILSAQFSPSKAASRPVRRVYDEGVRQALVAVWNAAGQICSKRLAPFLPEFVGTLERFGHLSLTEEVRSKLIKLSPASIDRLLKTERQKHPRGRSTTKPANLLKQRIKVRTYAEWDETGPGFFEADLVAHCGDRVDGPFVNSLVMTDIATGWTEFVPLLRKCDADVIAGLDAIRTVLPVPVFGLDTDNGCEFINNELLAYCEKNAITFTRSRAYKKNDQAHIEQKNGSVIRRVVGYDRFEGLQAYTSLMQLYRVLRLYVNFFQPSCKLVKKTRTGSRTTKEYDRAKTPAQRLLESEQVACETKLKLETMRKELDPVHLFEQIGELQELLWSTAITDPLPIVLPKQTKHEVPKAAPSEMASSNTRLLNLKPIMRPKRAYTSRMPHTWRTRPDPLAGTYDYAKLVFALEPQITSTQLLARLSEKYPDQITGKELKTLQRRLSKWRRESLKHHVSLLTGDTTYDGLPYNISLKELTEKALQFEIVPE